MYNVHTHTRRQPNLYETSVSKLGTQMELVIIIII